MNAGNVEREVKLRFASPGAARTAILATEATPLKPRRLQDDRLLDTSDGQLRERRCVLRVRREGDTSVITFKGPTQPSRMKLRPEIETAVGDATRVLDILAELGFVAWFRYQKYREEFSAPGVVVALDETPVGTFVEVEGDERSIDRMASRLGRTSDDYLVKSYFVIFNEWRQQTGSNATDMVFDAS